MRGSVRCLADHFQSGFDVLASDVIASVVDSVNNKTIKNTG
jgi:hypothetical protein